jgi:hypothetical protein
MEQAAHVVDPTVAEDGTEGGYELEIPGVAGRVC